MMDDHYSNNTLIPMLTVLPISECILQAFILLPENVSVEKSMKYFNLFAIRLFILNVCPAIRYKKINKNYRSTRFFDEAKKSSYHA